MWLSYLSAHHTFPEEKEFGTRIFLVVPFFTQPSIQSEESVRCEYRGAELLSKQLHDGFASFQKQPDLGEGLTERIEREKYLNIFSIK